MEKQIVDALEKTVAQLTDTIKSKFDEFGGLTAEVKELQAKLADVNKEWKEKKHQFEVSQTFSKSIDKARKAELETRLDEIVLFKALCHNVDTKQFNKAAFDKLLKLPVYADAIKAFGDVSAMTTVATSEGVDWIPQAFSSTLQEEIWLGLEVAKLFRRMPMPAATYTLPFSPGRLIALAGTEGGEVAKQKGKTGKIVFTAKKIKAVVEMTDEFEEESLVPALNFLRGQLIEAFALGQETMVINGDTGQNIYVAGKVPGASDVRSLVRGVRADAMSTGAKVDFGAASGFTAANLRALRTTMGKYGKKPSDLAYVVTMADYNKMLAFDGYQKLYEYGAGSVLLNGELGRIDNIPVIVTELLPLGGVGTDTADSLGGLNVSGVYDDITETKTTCILTNRNGYCWGDRSEFSLELWRNPLAQTTNLIGSQRLDFQKVSAAANRFSAVGFNY